MQRHVIPDAEYRLILLMMISRIGAMSSGQMLIFVTDLDLMNYFGLQLNLIALVEQGQVELVHHPFGDLYELTDKGRYALEHFSRTIPISRRHLIDQKAPEYKTIFRSEQLMPAFFKTLPDGSTWIRLQLLERDLVLMDLAMQCEKCPTYLETRWTHSATEIYQVITETLTEGYVPDAQIPDIPSSTSITRSVRGEWTLYMPDPPDEPSFYIIVSLADEALCRHWAHHWPAVCQGLRTVIWALLDNAVPPQRF